MLAGVMQQGRWGYHMSYQSDLPSIRQKGLLPAADTTESWDNAPGIYFVDTFGYEAGPAFDAEHSVWLRFPWPEEVPFTSGTMSEHTTMKRIDPKTIQVWKVGRSYAHAGEPGGKWVRL